MAEKLLITLSLTGPMEFFRFFFPAPKIHQNSDPPPLGYAWLSIFRKAYSLSRFFQGKTFTPGGTRIIPRGRLWSNKLLGILSSKALGQIFFPFFFFKLLFKGSKHQPKCFQSKWCSITYFLFAFHIPELLDISSFLLSMCFMEMENKSTYRPNC